MVNGDRLRVRRREIGEADLGGIVDLLGRGFPARSRAYWERGLARMAARPVVEGCLRYGLMLDTGTGPVGTVLTLFSQNTIDGTPSLRCNLSSWTVDPDYRVQAPLLVSAALKRADVTYTNISPAPHTWPTIEAQGFVCYANGQTLVAPALSAVREAARIRRDPADWSALAEAPLLADHAGYGCTCLVVEAADGLYPFVFLPFRARSGRLPLPFLQLIHCRGMVEFARFAGVIGRALLRRGVLGVVLDGQVTGRDLVVVRRVQRGRKYAKGPHRPRIGDLSYTERVIFGA